MGKQQHTILSFIMGSPLFVVIVEAHKEKIMLVFENYCSIQYGFKDASD